MNKRITSFIRQLYNEPDEFIPLHAPVFSGKEKEYLNDCIDSTFVSSVGAYVNQFEELVREHTNSTRAIAVVNGTCGLTAALSIVGVKPNDLVITQGLTFVATANAIVHTGATPVFLDSDTKTMGLSPESLNDFLNTYATQRNGQTVYTTTGAHIGAVVPMHVFGHACRIDELKAICDRWNIPLVEDAAEALGSTYKGKSLGTFGKLGILSFNGNKTITTGGGGMILCQEETLGKRVKHLVNTAKVPHPWEFHHDEVAWNYRMPNLNAALGCAQMERLDDILKQKRDIAHSYFAFFANMDEVEFVAEPADCHSNFWLCAVLFQNKPQKEAFLQFANDNGVMTRPIWQLMPDLPMYREAITDGLAVARDIADRLVNLPSGLGRTIS